MPIAKGGALSTETQEKMRAVDLLAPQKKTLFTRVSHSMASLIGDDLAPQ